MHTQIWLNQLSNFLRIKKCILVLLNICANFHSNTKNNLNKIIFQNYLWNKRLQLSINIHKFTKCLLSVSNSMREVSNKHIITYLCSYLARVHLNAQLTSYIFAQTFNVFKQTYSKRFGYELIQYIYNWYNLNSQAYGCI